MRPAAYYPSSYFPYEKPGIVSSDRLEGTLKLTPALGQKQIYLLVYTTKQDLATTTQMTNPAKAYAAGVGNAIPDIRALAGLAAAANNNVLKRPVLTANIVWVTNVKPMPSYVLDRKCGRKGIRASTSTATSVTP